MKKKNIIYIIFISLLFCISVLFRISYAYEYEDKDLIVKIKVASVTKNNYEREFEVVYENKKHTLKVVSDYYKEFYELEDSPTKNKMTLYFDDKEVRDFKLDISITDFRNLPIQWI